MVGFAFSDNEERLMMNRWLEDRVFSGEETARKGAKVARGLSGGCCSPDQAGAERGGC